MHKDNPPLWKHQQDIINKAFSVDSSGNTRSHLALFCDMGVGKTRCIIEILSRHFKNEAIRNDSLLKPLRTIIFCPPVVIQNWRREFLRYSDIDPNKIIPLYGSQKNRVSEFARAVEFYSDFIAITNYESLLMTELFGLFLSYEPEVLVFDESHMLKDLKAKRTKLALKLSRTKKIRYKYILSGTPILNSPMDIFSQFLIMDGGESFGSNFFSFRWKYFYDKNAHMPRQKHFPKWELIPGSTEQINKIIDDKSFKITKKQALPNLPPLVRKRLDVGLLDEQKRIYKEVSRDFISYISGSACVAQFAMTKALRLMQVVSGFVKLEDGRELNFYDNPRINALRDLITDLTLNHKVIVWAAFKQNYIQIKALCDALHVGYVEVHGMVSASNKQRAVDQFNNDALTRVFIAHPAAGGVGLNLTASDYSIYFSKDFSLEHDWQSESRNYRGGSEVHEVITRIDLICPGTIDEVILQALERKQGMGHELLKTLKDGICEQSNALL